MIDRPADTFTIPTSTTDPLAAEERLFSRRNGVYAAALAGGVVLHAINLFMTTTVMPSVVADIGGLDAYAWATTLFVVASILAAALTARLLAAFGPRGAYCIAALAFGIGTLIGSLAPNMPVLLLSRTVQGFGGGFLYALAYAVTRLVLPPALWSRAVGLIASTFGVATLIGPAVGGIFAELHAWRAAFWSLLPFVALFAAIAAWKLPGKRPGTGEKAPIAWLQLVLLAAAVLVVSAGSLSPDPRISIAGLVVALALTAWIGRVERRARARLLPRGSFSMAAPLGLVYLVIALLMMALQPDIFMSYLLQTLHGQTPLIAGYLASLIAIGWTAGTTISVRVTGGGRPGAIVVGVLFVLAGLCMLGILLPLRSDGALGIVAVIAGALVVLGIGIGIAWPALVTHVYRYAPRGEQDLASGGMTTIQLFASALGTAMAGMVANLAGFVDPGGADGAASAAYWLVVIAALWPILSLPLALRILGLGRQDSMEEARQHRDA